MVRGTTEEEEEAATTTTTTWQEQKQCAESLAEKHSNLANAAIPWSARLRITPMSQRFGGHADAAFGYTEYAWAFDRCHRWLLPTTTTNDEKSEKTQSSCRDVAKHFQMYQEAVNRLLLKSSPPFNYSPQDARKLVAMRVPVWERGKLDDEEF